MATCIFNSTMQKVCLTRPKAMAYGPHPLTHAIVDGSKGGRRRVGGIASPGWHRIKKNEITCRIETCVWSVRLEG